MRGAMIKKRIYIRADLIEQLKKEMEKSPGMSLTGVVNQALEDWLQSRETISLIIPPNIDDKSEGFGPQAKHLQ